MVISAALRSLAKGDRTRPIVDTCATFLITRKGQVAISKALRQQLGLGRGSRVCFALVEIPSLRPCRPDHGLPTSGFGLLSRSRAPGPVDFDPARLLKP